MIFVGPYLKNPNCHFNMNIVDSIGSKSDLIIDVKEQTQYTEKIKNYLKDKNVEKEIVVYNPFEQENFVIALKKELPKLKIFMYCSDDEWRCSNFDRYLALYVDFFSITEKRHLPLYQKWGFDNVIATNWACNSKKFFPINTDKKYDVSFVGAAYGQRVEYIKEAIRKKINVRVFGKGWDKYSEIKKYWGGYISSNQMNQVFNQSKINLNFMWSSKGGYQIKGRSFEISGSRAFQLCNHGNQLVDFFKPDVDIGTFKNKKEFIEKIPLKNSYFPKKHYVTRAAILHTLSHARVEEKRLKLLRSHACMCTTAYA